MTCSPGLWDTTTVFGECCGWRRTGFVSSKSYFLFSLFLALLGPVRAWRERRQVCHLTALPPAGNGSQLHRFVRSFPATSAWFCHHGEGKRRYLFWEGNCLRPSYTSGQCQACGPSPRCQHTVWSCSGHQPASAACGQVVPVPPSLLLPVCPPSDFWGCGLFRCVC